MTGPQHRTDHTTTPEPVHAPEPAAPVVLANPRRKRLAHVRSYDELCVAGTDPH